MSTPSSVIASITAGLISLAGVAAGRADVDAALRAKLDEPRRHLAAAGVVDADEQHLGLLLHDHALGLAERLQPLAREPMGEHGDEDVDLRAAKQVGRLGDVTGDRLLREDPRELALQRLGRFLDVMPGDGIEHVDSRALVVMVASSVIDGDRCVGMIATVIDRCQYRSLQYAVVKPVATIAASVSAAARRAARPGGQRTARSGAEDPRRPRAPAAAEPDPGAARRRGVRLPSDRAARAQPANRQPPPQGPPRRRPRRARAPRQLGLLPRHTRAACSAPRRPRLTRDDHPCARRAPAGLEPLRSVRLAEHTRQERERMGASPG